MHSTGNSGELLSRGYQGIVYKVPAGPDYPGVDFLIVKEAMGSPLVRRFRRWMIRRESAVYQRLGDIAGVPRCFGMRDDCLLLEYVDGHPLNLSAGELPDRERFFAELLEILRSAHAAGVAHADMKRKDNILVTRNGRPCLIDFGSAILRAEGNRPWRRWIFEQACQIDLNAWIKHKYVGRYEDIDDADAEIFKPTIVERMVRPVRKAWRKLTSRNKRKARSAANR